MAEPMNKKEPRNSTIAIVAFIALLVGAIGGSAALNIYISHDYDADGNRLYFGQVPSPLSIGACKTVLKFVGRTTAEQNRCAETKGADRLALVKSFMTEPMPGSDAVLIQYLEELNRNMRAAKEKNLAEEAAKK